MELAISNFINACLNLEWASEMSATNSQKVTKAMVVVLRNPKPKLARRLLESSGLIVWPDNEAPDAVNCFYRTRDILEATIEAQ